LNTKFIYALFWICSSAILCLLGNIFFSFGPEYDGGIYYIVFVIIYTVTCLILRRYIKLDEFDLPFWAFALGVVFILFSNPLFENDQYRYLWEGKVLLSGGNPYVQAPDSDALNHIDYAMKEHIGYPHLTTVYPPLGIIWFSIVSQFPFEIGLRMLMVLNAGLCYFLFRLLKRAAIPGGLLILIFPYLQKEFIQAVHLDLFAASFLVFPLINLKTRVIEKITGLSSLLLSSFLSVWSKLIGLAALPFIIIHYKRREIFSLRNIVLSALLPMSIGLFCLTVIPDLPSSGGGAFVSHWEWNPGFYFILKDVIYLEDDESKIITLFFFLLYSAFVFLRYLQNRKYDPLSSLYDALFLLYAGMMFFSPVYNGWYAIWFLPFALLVKNTFGILYATMTCFSYIAYGHEQWEVWAIFFTHMWFVFIWISKLPRLQKHFAEKELPSG